jgi:L-Ala-D/L-Glu epimerase
VKLASIAAHALRIPFRTAFCHALAERAATQTLWIESRSVDGCVGYGESCPRDRVTGASLQSAAAFVARHRSEWLCSIHDVETLTAWAQRNARVIDENPAAWCAVEMALLDLLGRREGRSLDDMLGLPPVEGRFRYTAVLGDAPPGPFTAQLRHYVNSGFRDFKVKLGGDAGRDRIKAEALAAMGWTVERVRADSNNLWPDAMHALRALAGLGIPFWALEEPLRPGDYDGMARIADATGARIVLDESLLRAGQLARLPGSVGQWIVNLRISKMGGVLRSLAVVRELERRGLALIVGCHVGETSLLTRAALTVAQAARSILLAQEGAYGTHLLERDVVDAPLRFGAGGVLEIQAGAINGRGLGLEVQTGPADLIPLAADQPCRASPDPKRHQW